MSTPNALRPRGLRLLARNEYVTAEAIYGTLLICAVLAAADDEPESEVLITGVAASFVFWFAHAFAITITRRGVVDGRRVGLRGASLDAAYHSAGFLTGPIIPILILTAGTFDVIDGTVAYWAALSSGVAVLVAMGIVAGWELGLRWYRCVLGGIATGLVGLVIITLKAIFD
ncbi:hypothetical protein [Subtercola sp. YIM 133946]|uniref:hypothetical protein n=1 Tax=Subtercola sp. YIM 133946 TaxID=3118909 RepID=UPI002F9236E9